MFCCADLIFIAIYFQADFESCFKVPMLVKSSYCTIKSLGRNVIYADEFVNKIYT